MRQKLEILIAGALLISLLASCGPAPTQQSVAATVPVQATVAAPTATPEPPIHLKLGMFNFASFAPLYLKHISKYLEGDK